MVRRQRCLQLEAMHSGYGYPRSHPITLKTEKIVILAQLKFVYCTVVCYSPVDNFQVLSIGYNIFKITSLPILRNLHSLILPAPTLICTHIHTHKYIQVSPYLLSYCSAGLLQVPVYTLCCIPLHPYFQVRKLRQRMVNGSKVTFKPQSQQTYSVPNTDCYHNLNLNLIIFPDFVQNTTE